MTRIEKGGAPADACGKLVKVIWLHTRRFEVGAMNGVKLGEVIGVVLGTELGLSAVGFSRG